MLTNGHEVRVIGMSRSGNHAIIDWLLHQMPGRRCFLNCAEPGQNPFETARPLGDQEVCASNLPGFDLAAERAGRHQPKDWLVHSYEDVYLRRLAETRETPGVGGSARRTDLLILRDPFNLFASRRRFGLFERDSGVASYIVTLGTALRIWKQHARQFLGRRRVLPGRVIPVSYPEWTKSCAYRQSLAAELGVPFDDARFACVPDTAGGSSFDFMACADDAAAMKVHQRWRHYADDPDFRELFDAETIELARNAFGPMDVAISALGLAPSAAASPAEGAEAVSA